MDLGKALKTAMFEKCEFGPDGDPCDSCDKTNLQLYYRRTCYEVNEGDYYCGNCVIKEAESIDSLMNIKCACGSVFMGYPHQQGGKCEECHAETYFADA